MRSAPTSASTNLRSETSLFSLPSEPTLWPRRDRERCDFPASFVQTPQTFEVEEVPDGPWTGEGEHLLVQLRKVGQTTHALAKAFQTHFHLTEDDVGYAGQKDRHATTTQWFSLRGLRESDLATFAFPGTSILATQRHARRLRLGHLQGNRFCLHLTPLLSQGPLVPPPETADLGAENPLLLSNLGAENPPLSQPDLGAENPTFPQEARQAFEDEARRFLRPIAEKGMPNFFGPQRFGRTGKNAEEGRALIRQESYVREAQMRRFLISAWQSAFFNALLARRITEGALDTLLEGDLLLLPGDPRPTLCRDPRLFQAQADAQIAQATGWMPGSKVAPAQGIPGLWETELFEESGVKKEDFRIFGKIAQGTRRPCRVPVSSVSLQTTDHKILLSFFLPSGSYASVLLAQIGISMRLSDPEDEA